MSEEESYLHPDSEGGWICGKHLGERDYQKYGSNCYRCLKESHKALVDACEKAIETAGFVGEVNCIKAMDLLRAVLAAAQPSSTSVTPSSEVAK